MILSEGWAERVIQLSHSGLSNFTACLIHTSQPHTCRGHSALTGIRVQRTKVDSKVNREFESISYDSFGAWFLRCKIVNPTTSVSERCDGRREKDTRREGGRERMERERGGREEGWVRDYFHMDTSSLLQACWRVPPFPLFSTTHTLDNPQL